MAMLSLPEQLLLLATDDVNGTDSHGAILDRALIAAALMDLVLQGRIVRRQPGEYPGERSGGLGIYPFWYFHPTYHLADSATATGSAYLDLVLTTIAAHYKINRLHNFATLALVYLDRSTPVTLVMPSINPNPPNQRLLAAQDLLAREQLVAREERVMGILLWTSLVARSGVGDAERLRQELQQWADRGGVAPDERFRALLLLIKVAGLIKDIWGWKKLGIVNRRIKQSSQLAEEPSSLLADARRYILYGATESDLQPLLGFAPIPR